MRRSRWVTGYTCTAGLALTAVNLLSSSRFGEGTGRRHTSSATTTGMRRSCCLGRTRRWSTRRAASAPEVGGLGLFEPSPGSSPPRLTNLLSGAGRRLTCASTTVRTSRRIR